MDTTRLRALLNTNVYVMGVMTDTGQVAFQNGRALFGTPAIPFFTTADLLLEAANPGQQVLAMEGKTFFDMTAGSRLVINPKSADRQEFSPEQVSTALRPEPVVAPVAAAAPPSKFRSIFSLKK